MTAPLVDRQRWTLSLDVLLGDEQVAAAARTPASRLASRRGPPEFLGGRGIDRVLDDVPAIEYVRP